MLFTVASVSPAVPGKACPAGGSFTSQVPQVEAPAEMLSDATYLHHVVDGDAMTAVSCRVAGTGRFELEGKITQGTRSLQIADGVVEAGHGTARIVVIDAQHLSTPLSSPLTCSLNVSTGATQIQRGAVWATFDCASVEAPPSDYCRASGVFVLENCEQD